MRELTPDDLTPDSDWRVIDREQQDPGPRAVVPQLDGTTPAPALAPDGPALRRAATPWCFVDGCLVTCTRRPQPFRPLEPGPHLGLPACPVYAAASVSPV